MDIYGMYDRLLEHSGKALRWLDKHAYLEAQRELEKVVTQDGKYVPRELKASLQTEPPPEEPATISALAKPLPPARSAESLVATELTIHYPGGSHTFHKVAPDVWTLSLETPEGPGPDVTGYDNGNVLRVVAAFLVTLNS